MIKVLITGTAGFIGSNLAEKLLDVGGHEVTGIDYSERSIKFARIFVPEAKFFQVDLREVNKKSWLRDRSRARAMRSSVCT